MLYTLNFAVITLLTVFCIAVIYKLSKNVTIRLIHIHLVVMTISVISSLCIGSILGMIFGHDIVLSTIISTFVGMIIGFMVGKPFSYFVMLGGMIEGIMGAMMGAMLGMMVHHSAKVMLFLFFINLIFFIMMSTTIAILNQSAKKPNLQKVYSQIC